MWGGREGDGEAHVRVCMGQGGIVRVGMWQSW
jgi:hypothetical protein